MDQTLYFSINININIIVKCLLGRQNLVNIREEEGEGKEERCHNMKKEIFPKLNAFGLNCFINGQLCSGLPKSCLYKNKNTKFKTKQNGIKIEISTRSLLRS